MGAWNVLGMAVNPSIAVTLGVGSAPGSLIRFNFESAWLGRNRDVSLGAGPAFFVPLYLLMHVAIFAGLVASAHTAKGESRPVSGWAGTPSASRLIGCVRRIDESGRSARAARASLYR